MGAFGLGKARKGDRHGLFREPSEVLEAAVGMTVEGRCRRRPGQLPWGPSHLGANLWGTGSSWRLQQ